MTEPLASSDAEVVNASRRPIDPRRVSALLTGPLRWRVEQVAVTGSTNADLAGAAASTESGQVRTAEEQLTGRGRSGRDWFCPPGAGLMFSALLRLPQVPADRRGWTGALLGLAIVQAVHRAYAGAAPVVVGLKWPNDVLLDGRKCAGILGEAVEDAVVVGAGINVSLGVDELPRDDATSLLLAGGGSAAVRFPEAGAGSGESDGSGDSAPPADSAVALPAWLDRPALLAGILDTFGDLLDRWVAADGDVDASGLREEHRRHCSTIGTTVRLILPGGAELTAVAVDVAPDGALVVRDDAGRRTAYSAADVVHLRSAAGA